MNKSAGGGHMKIKDVKTWAVANPPPHRGGPFWVFVRLTTDNALNPTQFTGSVAGDDKQARWVNKMETDLPQTQDLLRTLFY